MKFHLHADFRSKPPAIFQRTAGGSYYVRQQIHKHRYTRSLHTSNRKEAEKLAYKRWFLQQGKAVHEIVKLPSDSLLSAMELYRKSKDWELLEESTREHKFRNWRAFVDWCDNRGLTHVDDINTETAETYLESRESSNKTFNNILGDLRLIFADICRLTRQDNPFDRIQYRSTKKGEKISKPFRSFADSEILKILSHIPTSRMRYRDEWLTACNIARYTGLRYKDIAHLQWTHIHRERIGKQHVEFIELVPCKTVNSTGKAVILSIIPELAAILKGIKRTSFYVLPNLAATYDETHATEPFSGILKHLEINGSASHIVGFHSFRATVTTKARKAGVDMKRFGGVLGHTTEEQTEHYDKSALEIDLSFLAG